MEDDDRPFVMPYLQAPRVRAPEPPGGFRQPRKPKAAGGRQRRREAEAAQLRLAGIFRAGAAVIGAAVVVLAIMVIILIVQEH